MTVTAVKHITIKGVTKDGRKFRPSDWAQRLTNAVASYGPGRRVKFHPMVKMVTVDGINCVVMDSSLEEEDPMVFNFLINFANSNNLDTVEE